jgi:hypothetical protein
MRKIKMHWDTKNGYHMVVTILNETNEITTLPPFPTKEISTTQFTAEELIKIMRCNTILSANKLPPLTDDEEVFLVNPVAWVLEHKLNTDVSPARLQELAGFTVEKIIRPYNDPSDRISHDK